MSINVKFFASLREQVGISDTQIDAADMTVSELWHQVTNAQPFAENILTAVNMDYVERDHVVQDGDEVAFFPPVTGG